MSHSWREAQVRTFIAEVWNGRNYDASAELYGEAFSNALGTGPQARSEVIRRYHQAFPDLRLDVDELIVAGTPSWSEPPSVAPIWAATSGDPRLDGRSRSGS